MAKYKVLNKFIDKETKELHKPGDEIDILVKRAEEIEEAAKYGVKYLERVHTSKKDTEDKEDNK